MRKLFRMQYEPCKGTCYAANDVFSLKQLADDPARLDRVLSKLIKAHGPACGNEHIRYGLDLDEDHNLFIGSFLHYGKLELLTGSDAAQVIEDLCDTATSHFESKEGLTELKKQPGLGHSVCEHGDNQNLIDFVLKMSGLAA